MIKNKYHYIIIYLFFFLFSISYLIQHCWLPFLDDIIDRLRWISSSGARADHCGFKSDFRDERARVEQRHGAGFQTAGPNKWPHRNRTDSGEKSNIIMVTLHRNWVYWIEKTSETD